jgi:hypothetical protein
VVSEQWSENARVKQQQLTLTKNIPQGLKPNIFWGVCGTTEVVPFQNLKAAKRCTLNSVH